MVFVLGTAPVLAAHLVGDWVAIPAAFDPTVERDLFVAWLEMEAWQEMQAHSIQAQREGIECLVFDEPAAQQRALLLSSPFSSAQSRSEVRSRQYLHTRPLLFQSLLVPRH